MAQSVEWILMSEIFPSEIISCKKFSDAFFVSGNHPLEVLLNISPMKLLVTTDD